MRLLDSTSLRLSQFFDRAIPKYVILSHTWGQDEVTFEDIQDLAKAKMKSGFSKIEKCCERARLDGFQWVWIDTCCIEKSSSAELSEAINSMFQWYKNCQICYAYLADVYYPEEDMILGYEEVMLVFGMSRWWERGWTLQELIAPTIVEFYAADWTEIGTKSSLLESVSEITGIQAACLDGSSELRKFNVATRMSWASKRQTTRKEDEAYCLMGIFSVHMPLLYGEGIRAFHRLQEEILKITEDYTLFAWMEPAAVAPGYSNSFYNIQEQEYPADGILARSPANFNTTKFKLSNSHLWMIDGWRSYVDLLSSVSVEDFVAAGVLASHGGDAPRLTSRGLSMTLPVLRMSDEEHLVCLTSSWDGSKSSPAGQQFLCLALRPEMSTRLPDSSQIYSSADRRLLKFVSQEYFRDSHFEYSKICIARPDIPRVIGSIGSNPPEEISSSVIVLTDKFCSISDAYLLWRDDEDVTFTPLYARNEFPLVCRSSLWWRGQSISFLQAVFQFTSNTLAPELTKFIVGIGTTEKNVPWCSLLLQSNAEARMGPLGIRTLATRATDLIESQKLFERPLSESFYNGASYINRQSHIRILESKSDRAVVYLPGFKISVAVRRGSVVSI